MKNKNIFILICTTAILIILALVLVGNKKVNFGANNINLIEGTVTNTNSDVTAAASGTNVLGANSARQYVRLKNAGPDSVYLRYQTATNQTTDTVTTGTGLLLNIGDSYEIKQDNLYLGDIVGRAETQTSTLIILEK